MTVWDSLLGRGPGHRQDTSHSSPPSPSDSLSPLDTTLESSPPVYPSDLHTTSVAQERPPSGLYAQDVSSMLGGGGSDPSRLHPLANLGQSDLDYLTLDESILSDLPGGQSGALPSRGWSDDLCYGTGVTYISALSIGGAWGLAEGLRRSPASAPPKLRLNSVLNSITRRGPFLGNSAGVIAIVYNLINSTFGHYRGKHDASNSIAAGALSGMLFKSTRGLRPMMISSGLVAGAAGTWTLARKALF